jgi:hypothetical protein
MNFIFLFIVTGYLERKAEYSILCIASVRSDGLAQIKSYG